MGLTTAFLLGLMLINFISMIVMRQDKQRAIKKLRRIPEANLWFIAFCGGSAGTLLAMKLWRHKTRKLSFRIGIPSLLIVHSTVLFLYFVYFHPIF